MRIPISARYALNVAVAILAGCNSGGSVNAGIPAVPGAVSSEVQREQRGRGCPAPVYEVRAETLYFEARQKVSLSTELITYYYESSHRCLPKVTSPKARWTSSGGHLHVMKVPNSAVFSATAGQYVVTAKFDGHSPTVTLTVQVHNERLLSSFGCSTCGSVPAGGLLAGGGGTFFGTTSYGGSGSCPYSHKGCGTVFRLTRGGSGAQVTILYAFRGGSDGVSPAAALISDATGALYGTTTNGGTANAGTVFRLMPNGSGYDETVLYSFQGGSDGIDPLSALIKDKSGALYGTTSGGGSSDGGTVYRLTPGGSGYTENILYSFPGGKGQPRSGLIEDKHGALYGTSLYGGSHGQGSVFRLTPHGSEYEETDLYSFTGYTDGSQPFGTLIADKNWALYGTAWVGGARGVGNVFKLTPKGSGYNETVLYSFQGGSDGANPTAGLIEDKSGALYGTTENGGDYGTVFKLTPAGSTYSESLLHIFGGATLDGAYPICALIAQTGILYGTTLGGGSGESSGFPGGGTVFIVKKR